jgi:uncharacterized protein YodC (DUF2158 family)
MDYDFKTGDTVVLKSGGPEMTVVTTGYQVNSGEPSVWCECLNGTQIEDAIFPIEAIEHLKP